MFAVLDLDPVLRPTGLIRTVAGMCRKKIGPAVDAERNRFTQALSSWLEETSAYSIGVQANPDTDLTARTPSTRSSGRNLTRLRLFEPEPHGLAGVALFLRRFRPVSAFAAPAVVLKASGGQFSRSKPGLSQ